MKKVWGLLAGDYVPPLIFPQINEAVIAIDGGIIHAKRLEITPQVWLGDFDSSEKHQFPHVDKIVYPVDKDKTDFELALAYLSTHYPNHICHIIGSHGNEADHSFGNLWVLPQINMPVILYQQHNIIVYTTGQCQLSWQAEIGDKVSIFAFTPLQNVCSQGLRWQLSHHHINPFNASAARNEMQSFVAEIQWQSGHGLVFLPVNTKNLKID